MRQGPVKQYVTFLIYGNNREDGLYGTALSLMIARKALRRAPLDATIRILRLFFSIELFLAIAAIPFFE